ncbi:anoctamin-5-like isoform X2 [Vicugna pacos]|uniref:Anoctamin-5-like isoform X2 n=1 Tax=Vicugna pacos TaxID=30538 RepID=A0ABM5CY66_VICPA
MIFETCHTSRAFAVGWEASQSESALWNVLGDKLLFAKVYTLWEVLCTYAEILHIILPLKPNDLKTRSSAFGNFSCFMKVLQVDQSIIKPKQEFFIALFEKSCVNDFYIQDRDIFFNPTTRSRICDPSGCLLELMTQLTIIMGGQSIWNNIQEVLLPSKGIDVVLPSVYHSMLCVHSLNRYSVWVHQIICGLFPVAPLLALENNILEIRLGTWKLDYKL